MKAYGSKKDKKVILKKGNFLQLVQVGRWEYSERVNCSAIVIIVSLTDKKEVIFVEQYRPPLRKNVIEFPAGLINDSEINKRESLIAGARRELIEETGYRAGKIKRILTGPVSSGSSGDKINMLLATDLKKVSDGGGVEFETIKVHEIPINNVDTTMKNFGEDLEKNINEFSKNLQSSMEERIKTADNGKIILDIHSKEYQSINTNTGSLLVAVDRLEKSNDGYRLYLNIGNPHYASFKGYKITLYCGKKFYPTDNQDYAAWQNSLTGTEYSFEGDIRKGAWNQAVLDLSVKDISDLAYVEMEMSISSIELQNIEETTVEQ